MAALWLKLSSFLPWWRTVELQSPVNEEKLPTSATLTKSASTHVAHKPLLAAVAFKLVHTKN